jgi:hypothetical protein
MNRRHVLGFVVALSLNTGVALALSESARAPAATGTPLAEAEAAVDGSLPEVVVTATRIEFRGARGF